MDCALCHMLDFSLLCVAIYTKVKVDLSVCFGLLMVLFNSGELSQREGMVRLP